MRKCEKSGGLTQRPRLEKGTYRLRLAVTAVEDSAASMSASLTRLRGAADASSFAGAFFLESLSFSLDSLSFSFSFGLRPVSLPLPLPLLLPLLLGAVVAAALLLPFLLLLLLLLLLLPFAALPPRDRCDVSLVVVGSAGGGGGG